MKSWAEPTWPEEYHCAQGKLQEVETLVEETADMLSEASIRTQPFWRHQLDTLRMEQRDLEAKIRQFKQTVRYEDDHPWLERLCRL